MFILSKPQFDVDANNKITKFERDIVNVSHAKELFNSNNIAFDNHIAYIWLFFIPSAKQLLPADENKHRSFHKQKTTKNTTNFKWCLSSVNVTRNKKSTILLQNISRC